MGRPKKQKEVIPHKTFEECYDTILSIIESRRFRWQLKAINWYDFEDVKMHLLFHIYTKWHLYDQTKSLKTWVTVVVNNQMFNLIRNLYGNMKRPCLECPHYGGENICDKFKTCNTKCDLFKAWTFGKKNKYEIQLPVSIEDHQNEVYDISKQEIDIDKTAVILHDKMKKILKPLEWIVYKGLFIDHKSEVEVAKSLGFKSTEKGRDPGYKQLNNLRRAIMIKVKKILQEGEIEMI